MIFSDVESGVWSRLWSRQRCFRDVFKAINLLSERYEPYEKLDKKKDHRSGPLKINEGISWINQPRVPLKLIFRAEETLMVIPETPLIWTRPSSAVPSDPPCINRY